MYDRQLPINQIANIISKSCERVVNILYNELGLTKVSARWVPRFEQTDQKSTCLISSRENLTFSETEPSGSLTQDEYWFHQSELETRYNTCCGNIPAPKEINVVSPARIVIASAF